MRATAPGSVLREHTELTAAPAWALFCASLAALMLLWMPMSLLRQIDAFLAFMTPLELTRDAALAALLICLPAALLTLLATAVGSLAKLAGASTPTRSRVRWLTVLLPTLWLCVWQLAGGLWAWAKLVFGSGLSIGANGRVVAAIALLTLLVWLARRGLLMRLVGRVIPSLLSMRWLALGLLGLSAVFLALNPPRTLATTRTAQPTPPNATAVRPDIYLITIDTLAEQDAAVCGDGPTLMPRLRAFAGQATCFSRHYASSNFTTPTTATMETGALPWSHWAVQIVSKVAPALQPQSLAHRLTEAGYATHSISANILASPRHHGTLGGYATHDISPTTALGSTPRTALTMFPDTTLPFWLAGIVPFLDTIDVYSHGERHPYPPEASYAAAMPLLQQQDRPIFMWVHTLPPHDPYLPSSDFKYKLLPPGELDRWSQFFGMGSYAPQQQGWIDKHRLRYREAIMGSDAALGRFLDQLDRQGKLDQALIIISSDHGESFERGYIGHAGELIHNAVLQVPLVIKLPGQRAGRTIDTPVSMADLAPTMADYAGVAPLSGADGRSLRPALEGGTLPAKPVFAMAMERQSRFVPITHGHYAVIDGDLKLILDLASGRSELYALRDDPQEQKGLSGARPEDVRRLRALLQDRLDQAEQQRRKLFAAP